MCTMSSQYVIINIFNAYKLKKCDRQAKIIILKHERLSDGMAKIRDRENGENFVCISAGEMEPEIEREQKDTPREGMK